MAKKYEKRVEEFIGAVTKEMVREKRLNRTAPAIFLDHYIHSPKDRLTSEQLFDMKSTYSFHPSTPIYLHKHLGNAWGIDQSLPKSSSVLRKTHFKGVLTKTLLTPFPTKTPGHSRTRATSDATTLVMARDVLSSCNIIQPHRGPVYLKAGAGRLTSNPGEAVKKIYRRLYSGQLPCPSHFTL